MFVQNTYWKVLSIEFNIENYPLQNQIYDIIAELKNQGKHITLYKIPVHIGFEGNESAGKAAKEAIHVIKVAFQDCLNTNYFPAIKSFYFVTPTPCL